MKLFWRCAMRGFGKGNFILGGLIFLFVSAEMFGFGAGGFYPKYYYDFNLQNYKNYEGNGRGAYGILEAADGTQQEIDLYFGTVGNSFKDYIDFQFLTSEKKDLFYLNELKIQYENKEKVLLENAVFQMPENVYSVETSDKERTGAWYLSNGKYFWTRAVFVKPLDEKKRFPEINTSKFFKGKKDGDKFPCSVTVKYRFDDEDEKELVFEYIVEVEKNWYVSPFAGS